MELGQPKLWQTLFAILIVLSTVFVRKLYRACSYVRKLQREGLPMPPHSWLLGHLPLTASIVGSLLKRAHGVYLGDQIRQRYAHLNTAFYLDIWPFGTPVLVVLKPDMMYQLTQANQIPKDKGMRNFLRPLTGEKYLVTLEGPEWKHWRARFNPGSSAGHISTLVSGMVEETEIFKHILKEHAVSVLIVSRDHSFHSQMRYNEMTSSLRNQILWCTTGLNFNLLEYINIFRPFVHIYNTRKMNRYLTRELDSHYKTLQASGEIQAPLGKSVIHLALKAYLLETPSATGINSAFKEFAMAQIKLFIFAGHDTTSAAAVFTYHLLSQHPDTLAKVRSEHDEVFGKDSTSISSVLSSKPSLLSQLPFTLTVIKESMRIYPTVAALRDGQPGFSLIGDNGQRFPTDHCLIWDDHYAVHHNPKHWPEPESFLPERWLVSESHELYPTKDAWRPFERGPRNCIGQELALTEIKVMLAMTVRDFDIGDVYEEFDLLKGNKKGASVNGQSAYMMLRGGGHPVDHYPCKVKFARR